MRKTAYIIILFFGLGLSAASAQSPQGFGSSSSNGTICPLYIPNAFTPNGDNINDQFELRISENCEVVSFSLQVFDRWGRMVYQTESMEADQAWDGKSDNKELEQGVYLYKIQAEFLNYNNRKANPVKVNKQGSVVLIR
ncbi:MAG: gliding motility-associated C-terminal domain-containing protein [Bacteroidetes bacterium]|nr:gliding motility-associated C-terminal domain-containing protein [Bacteroidota bacterium]